MIRLLRAVDFPVRVDVDCSLRLVEDVALSLPAGVAALTAEAASVCLDLAGHRLSAIGAALVNFSGRDASLRVLRGTLGPCGAALTATRCAGVELEDVRIESFRDVGLNLDDVRESTLRRVELYDGSGAATVIGLRCVSGGRPTGLTILGLRVLGLRADRATAVLLSGLRRARLAAVEVSKVHGSSYAVGL
jgi:hypothetical protein